MTKYYAGIGSRKTPSEVCEKMTRIAEILSSKYILRSGGANGADSAFENGAEDRKEIYLPQNYFNSRKCDNKYYFNYQEMPGAVQAQKTVRLYHPAADNLSDYAFHLHSRNAMQILGKNMNDPVEFVVCWTPEGKFVGGTAQALKIARHYSIPIYNLAQPNLFYFLGD